MSFSITNFTVSSSLDFNRGGRKQSHFNSMAIAVTDESEESIKAHRAKMSFECFKNTVRDALVSGFISVEEATEMIQTVKSNYENVYLK